MTQVLHARPRDVSVSPKALRKSGKLPGVVYGPGVEGSLPVELDPKEFTKVFLAAGESEMVRVEGLPKVSDVLIYDIQRDPVTDEVIHVDLYAVAADQEVEVEVPLVFVGEAPAEKLGGTLTKVHHTLTVAALPRNLPHELTVDVSSLKTFEDKILAKDVPLPEGVRLVTDPEEVVALVVEQQEEAEAPVEEIDMSAIEVEKKGKKEKEEEAGREEEEA